MRSFYLGSLKLGAVMLALSGLACSPAAAQEARTADGPWWSIDAASQQATKADAVHGFVSAAVRQRQMNPLRAARLYAAVRVAQTEAVHEPGPLRAELAIGLSAAQALSWMLPQEDPARWTAWALTLAKPTEAWTHGDLAAIDAAVQPVLRHVLADRADARRRPLVKPAPGPGVWGRTPPLFAEQPAEPQGAQWRPWCPGTDRMEIAPTVPHGSPQWHEEVQQMVSVRTRLTREQAAIAERWHLDAGSITPPGVWNAIVVAYLAQRSPPTPLATRQRALALVNMAMQDALVAAWRIKVRDWSERPVTAVRRELDAGFEPLLVTPPFPGYVSGHSTVSAAAAGVLSHYFPEEKARWHALAREAAISRLYGGIHFASDNEQGLALGVQVAQACLTAFEPSLGGAVPRLVVNAAAGTSSGFFALPRMRAGPE